MAPPEPPDARLTLVALEGRDQGTRFVPSGEAIPIGRGAHDPAEEHAVVLTDPTVSSKQAVIRVGEEEVVLEHCPGATNPTMVNGERVERHVLSPGDRIRMGAVVLEVASTGRPVAETSPGVATRVFGISTPAQRTPDEVAETTTIVRPVQQPWGRLVMLRGFPSEASRYFVLHAAKVSIGRNLGEDLQIHDPGVSRIHAELQREGSSTKLLARSRTNPTYVNGVPVEGSQLLKGGEEIQLADRVAFRFEAFGAPAADPDEIEKLEEVGLISLVERKLERERELERELQMRYGATGSFLDIDVVDSYGMKTEALRRDHIITSFNRFRDFAREVIEEHSGQVLNSNGDELMCFFESELRCVQAASALLERLPEFNRERNLLTRPFRVRQGAHTGESLVDREAGIAYSPTLDIAGHLQKQAEVDGLMISEQTHAALPEGLPFEPAGTMERQGIPMFRLTGLLGERTDF